MAEHSIEKKHLSESMEWLSNSIKELFLLTDGKGQIKFLNLPFEQLLQCPLSEASDRSFVTFVHPEDREKVKKNLLFRKKDEPFRPFTHRCLLQNDSCFSLRWETSEKAEDGWMRMVGCLVDTETTAEKPKRQIGEGELLLLDSIENINEVLCIYDIEKNEPLYASPSFESFWGFSVEQSYKNPEIVSSKIRNVSLKELQSYFSTPSDKPREMEFELQVEEEFSKWVLTKIIPIVGEEEKISRYMCISYDITPLKEQDLLVKKWDKLGMVGQLAAGIAHEIRNPLTTIKGFLQLLGQETNTPYQELLLSELERIEFIMNEFLFLAKPQQDLKLEIKNLNKDLTDIVDFMRPEAVLNNIQLDLDCDPSLPLVYCESKQIKQVMMNLIKNAVEAMPTGGNISIQTMAKPDGYAMIRVCDEGMGIPKERVKRLFEPFYTSKEKGTGLGLMVSNQIIENHKGTLVFSSEVGKGTTACILLPGAEEEGLV